MATTPTLAGRARRALTALATTATLAACGSLAPTTPAPPVLGPERIAAIVASPDRSAADRVNDQRRKPEAMLAFIGIRPGSVALDVSADTIRSIIHHYTKEAGVRSLEREISTICRKLARETVVKTAGGKTTEQIRFRITGQNLPKYLGEPKYRSGKMEEKDEVGLCNGLAVTMHGGELLVTEVSVVPGKGKLVLTGKLGEVMQESAQAAMSYVRSRVDALGLERDFYQKVDLHVHFPEGAVPKDGPSAGITMVTSLVSALLRLAVRRDVAMTGEVTLRGRVLAIGGLKEKVLAAFRGGITHVICPKDNQKDFEEIPQSIRQQMQFHFISHVREAVALALVQGSTIFQDKAGLAFYATHLTGSTATPLTTGGSTTQPM